MKFKSFLIAALCICAILPTDLSAQKKYNRYGMPITVKDDGTVTVSGARTFQKLTGKNVYDLEDATIPYTNPKSKVISKDYKTIATQDFAYKTFDDGRQLMISVDAAENPAGPAPVLFCFHGGSWQKGSRTSMSSLTKTLAKEHGVTCVRVQYSFVGEESGIMMHDVINDCKDAVKYVVDHAVELNIDPARIGFMGQSSGGHLAAAMAISFPQTKLLIGNYGPYDLIYSSTYKREALGNKEPSKMFVNFRYALKGFDPEYISTVSPYQMAKAPLSFKAVLIQGTGDTTVYPDQATRFADKLRECGATDVSVVNFPYAAHSIASSCYRDDWYATIIEQVSTSL